VGATVASSLGHAFGDGLCFVYLAAVADPAHVAATVARRLELPGDATRIGAPAIAAALRSLSVLIVLDNCEHVVAAAAELAGALGAGAPGVRVLATSQEPLGTPGEHVVRLSPLERPPEGEPLELADAARYPALALFAERARSATPAFELDAQTLGPAAEICRRLDGVPLAIELAAARVPLLGVAGVAARLDRLLQLLTARPAATGGRHASLRDAIAWSYGLLAPDEQAVFRRLGVFAGSFSLDAAQHVASDVGDEWSVLGHVAALVEKSLLQVLGTGAVSRYRLLESARAFALEQLEAAGEAAASRRRHAEAVLALFDRADAAFFGAPLLPWIAGLMPEIDNLRAASAWARGPHGDPALAFALAAAAGGFWAAAGLDSQAGRDLMAVQDLVDEHTPLHRQAQFWLAMANRGLDLSVRAAELVEAAQQALALFRRLGDAQGIYRSLSLYIQNAQRLSTPIDLDALVDEMRRQEGPEWTVQQRRGRRWVVARQLSRAGDWPGYCERFRAEVAMLNEAGDEWRAWTCAHTVALAEISLGRPEEAVRIMEPAVQAIRAHGLARRCWPQVAMLAMARIECADPSPAAPAVREAVGLMRIAGSVWWLGDHLAWWLAQRGALRDAARLLGWVDTRLAERKEPRSPQGKAAHARLLSLLDALPEDRRAALRDEGARLIDDEVAEVVLAVASRAPS
jgi:predicted ATPase